MDFYRKDRRKMRLIFILLLSLMFCGLVTGMEYYTDVYDNVDVDAILKSERLLNQYMDCILDKGSCTADGRTLKRVLPEAVATTCKKCTLEQRRMARKIGNHLKQIRPKIWTAFLEKYDPHKEYIAAFEQFLAQTE